MFLLSFTYMLVACTLAILTIYFIIVLYDLFKVHSKLEEVP